jgi:stage IV sporulation protein FB
MLRFRFLGAEITLSFWFFAVAALFAAFCPPALAVYALLPIAVHELGHLAALFIFGVRIRAARLTAFGIDLQKSATSKTLSAELGISLAGAAANLLLAAGLVLFAFKSVRAMMLVAANVAVAAFNLLPIGSLDGGEAARLLCGYFFKPKLAYALSRAFSFLALVPLFAGAVFLLFRPERNFSLVILCVYLLFDIILKG